MPEAALVLDHTFPHRSWNRERCPGARLVWVCPCSQQVPPELLVGAEAWEALAFYSQNPLVSLLSPLQDNTNLDPHAEMQHWHRTPGASFGHKECWLIGKRHPGVGTSLFLCRGEMTELHGLCFACHRALWRDSVLTNINLLQASGASLQSTDHYTESPMIAPALFHPPILGIVFSPLRSFTLALCV